MHIRIKPLAVDWIKVGELFGSRKLSDKYIADICGTSQPQISRLFSGVIKNPAHPLGTAIEALFAQTFPNHQIPELASDIARDAHPAPQSVAVAGAEA